eukprot:m.118776 g.118776  ORF g.118776 m.118776 type:complete len:60 (-) comp14291_c0_seq1:124-303(-)
MVIEGKLKNNSTVTIKASGDDLKYDVKVNGPPHTPLSPTAPIDKRARRLILVVVLVREY